MVDQYFFQLADLYTFHGVRIAMDFLVITSFFACSFAFHNNATRYLYSMGRDGILPRSLGVTHPVHKSPNGAATVRCRRLPGREPAGSPCRKDALHVLKA